MVENKIVSVFQNPVIAKFVKIHFFYINQLLSLIPSFQVKLYSVENACSKFETFPKTLLFTI